MKQEAKTTTAFAEAKLGDLNEDLAELDDSPAEQWLLECVVTWGNAILHVSHRPAASGLMLCSKKSSSDPDAVILPSSLIGERPLKLTQQHLEQLFVLAPQGVPASLQREAEAKSTMPFVASFKQARQAPVSAQPDSHTTQPATEHLPERGIVLPPRARLTLHFENFDLQLSLVPPSKALPGGWASAMDFEAPAYFAACATVAASLLATMAFFVPPFGLQDEQALDQKRMLLISHYLDAASEKEKQRQEQPSEENTNETGGDQAGPQAKGAEGKAGKVTSKETAPRRAAIAGPRENKSPQLSRQELLHEATHGGMIGLLRSTTIGNASSSLFAADLAMGNADLNAEGQMWGDDIGESIGRGGLGLSGHGSGGGDIYGEAATIGMARVGTIGIGTANGKFGDGPGLKGGHESRVPQIRTPSEAITSGQLAPQLIQRTVRQNFGRFRMCYEQALGRNPSAEGRVSVRFVIGRDGSVKNVSASGDLPDPAAQSCVAAAFYGISFPQPQHGVVTVTYPLMFTSD